MRHTRWIVWTLVAGALAVAAMLGVRLAARVTVHQAFFDALGMGGVYATRWHLNLLLAVVGVVLALAVALPALLLGRAVRGRVPVAARARRPSGPLTEEEIERLTRRLDVADLTELRGSDPDPPEPSAGDRRARWAIAFGGAAVTAALSMAVTVPGLIGLRDRLLAAVHATAFGVTDPVFHRDVSFYVFTLPAWRGVVQVVFTALLVGTLGAAAVGLGLWRYLRMNGGTVSAAGMLSRTWSVVIPLGGVLVALVGVQLWLSRYAMTAGGGELVAGAGAAARAVDIPTRAVAAVLLVVSGLLMVAMGVRAVRERVLARVGTVVVLGSLLWALTGLALVVFASVWWLVLALPAAAAVLMAGRVRGGLWAHQRVPEWWVVAFAAVTTIVAGALGPVGALLNDAVVLRGNTLQVERDNIAATLAATRRAAGLEDAQQVTVTYRARDVTRAAVTALPASMGSLRLLDAQVALQACLAQLRDRRYTCDDVDVDRQAVAGAAPRTVLTMGREVSPPSDFPGRHFVWTHGYGLLSAPVDRVATDGGPRWTAQGIPQTGISPPLRQPGLYFGARPGMPWVMANGAHTLVADGNNPSTRVSWCTGATASACGGEGGTGIRVGSGWRRFAITDELGGIPYLGGGRAVWNATAGGADAAAGPDSRLLLYRDISSRLAMLAPFLQRDSDPWFAAAGGRVWVLQGLYVTTSAYPYAASFNGANYAREPVIAAMDAYSGRTHLFVMDPAEPMLRTWRAVYPGLFTDGAAMDRIAPGLRAHLRVGEDLFDMRSQALQRFHVAKDNVDGFATGAEPWVPTEEQVGTGAEGQRVTSPARFTYARLPGEARERFQLLRLFKPQAERASGLAAMLAMSSDAPFGRLTVVRFDPQNPPATLDAFTASVGQDDALSQQIGQRQGITRGDAMAVPIGNGLLYVQPLYLAGGVGKFPTLWRVVVSTGDGRVVAGRSLADALRTALGAGAPVRGTAPRASLARLVARAAEEWDAYRQAFGEGRNADAARHLAAFQALLARARALAARAGG
ncbi:MAG: UPF0182 family protein [Thermoleophilia bacterium]